MDTNADIFEKVCKELEEKEQEAINAQERGENAERSWLLPRTTALTLSVIISQHKPKTILELGTGVGYSAIWFAHSSKSYAGNVYTMERDPAKIAHAKETFKKALLNEHIQLLTGEIRELIKKWNQRIDFLFIDANKKWHLRYLRQLEPFFVTGTIVVVDNAIAKADILKDYLHYVTTSPDYSSTLLTIDNGVMISVRK